MAQDTWEIIDNKGTIHSGTEEEMRQAFDVMIDHDTETTRMRFSITRSHAAQLVQKYCTDWTGDLKLVKVYAVHN